MPLIEELWEVGCSLVPANKYDNLKIKGIWNTKLIFQPLPYERVFDSNFIIAQTQFQGCSFYSGKSIDTEELSSMIGQHFEVAKDKILPIKIATLDSIFVFGRNQKKPDFYSEKDGLSHEKACWRAKLVCNEVYKLFPKKTISVAIFGASGAITHELLSKDHKVKICDMNPNVMGKSICNIVVNNYNVCHREYIEESEIIIVTGMTLETQTIEEILKLAKEFNTQMVVYAQTGANIAPWYINYGADSVICENIPFYNFEGVSRIRIFRRKKCIDRL